MHDFKNNIIDADIEFGQHTRKNIFIHRVSLSSVKNEGYSFQLKRNQFCIELCFVITIKKAQEQTIPIICLLMASYMLVSLE